MTYSVVYSRRFKKDFKRLRPADKDMVFAVLLKLARGDPLEARHRDHALTGNLKGFRECHVKPDLLLVYVKDNKRLLIEAVRACSHSELF